MMIQDEELRNLYQTTGLERLQKLQLGLLHLEQEPDNPSLLEDLRRELHSLKGDSRSVELETIAQLSEQLEEVVQAIEHQELAFTLEVSDRLYQGLHSIGQLLHEAATGEASEGVDFAELSALLGSLVPTAGGAWPAGGAAAAASRQAGTLYIEDEELREIYRTTCESRLAALEVSLSKLAAGLSEAETLETLRRETHSLKGDSKAVGLDSLAEIVQTVEEIVKAIQPHPELCTPSVSTGLSTGLSAIRHLVEEAVTGQASSVELPAVQAALQAVGTAVSIASPPCPSAVEESLAAPRSRIEDEELREIYRTTSEDRLQQLESHLLYLEKHPQDESTLAALLREAHSLKGDSRSTGLTTVEALAHAVEDVLIGIQRQAIELDTAVSDYLYQGLDMIGQLVQEAVSGEAAKVNPEQLLQVLREIVPLSLPSAAESSPLPVSIERAPLPPSAPSERADNSPQLESVRVQSRELDALMAQAEALAVTRIQMRQTATQSQQLIALWEEWRSHSQQPPALDPSAPSYEERLETLLLALVASVQANSSELEMVAEDLRERVRKLQLLPLSILFQPLPRLVRDLAKAQSKSVNLVLEGAEVTADKRLLEGIRDSVMHLVRNALDHGIETPEARAAAGKPSTATLRVKAQQTAISLTLEISDDGQGLDIEQIKRTAVKRGLYRLEELERMSLSQIQQLILAPGFSTRSFITEISGRGVGLDVLRNQVERLKGSIQIESVPGQGCTFRLQLSTALSTANVVIVETQGIPLAIPIEFLQMSLLVKREQIVTKAGRATLTVGEPPCPVVDLVDVLELSSAPSYGWVARPPSWSNDRRPCVLLRVGEEQAAFLVDRLINQQEVVSKPLGPLLKRVRNVTGATILGTGEICMILNPSDLLKSLQRQTPLVTGMARASAVRRKPTILLVEDSPPVRIQEKRLFEGAGYEVVTAMHGLEGYNKLRTQAFDAVVSDVEMPHLDGFSLVARIRQHREYDELPVVLVTTLDSDADRRRGAEAGANAYIIKGHFNQEALLEALERLI